MRLLESKSRGMLETACLLLLRRLGACMISDDARNRMIARMLGLTDIRECDNIRFDWNPDDHPKGKDGRFIKKGTASNNGVNVNNEEGSAEGSSEYNDVDCIDLGKIEYSIIPVKHRKVSVHEFVKKFEEAKMSCPEEIRWRVDSHTEEELKGVSMYLTEGGSAVAVKPDGDIISVCKNQNAFNERGKWLLQIAVKHKGDRLDAYGGKLFKFYTNNGFMPICYIPFNKKFAPPGWRPEFNKEDKQYIVFYMYTGHKYGISYEDFIKQGKRFEADQYDEATEYRNSKIKKE